MLPLFDYIHSLDNLKLARKISEEQIKILNLKYLFKLILEKNLKKEEFKLVAENFYKKCVEEFKLNIIGLMSIPPFEKDSKLYFTKMKELSDNLDLKDISMGMSDDYMEAIKQGSTFIRVGSKIFGPRS